MKLNTGMNAMQKNHHWATGLLALSSIIGSHKHPLTVIGRSGKIGQHSMAGSTEWQSLQGISCGPSGSESCEAGIGDKR